MIRRGIVGSTLPAPRPSVARQGAVSSRLPSRGRDWLALVRQLEERAREVVCAAFPERGLKRFKQLPWFPYHGLSRARNGSSCPVARIAVWMAGQRALGMDRDSAQLIIDLLQSTVDQLWMDEDIDVFEASDEEQRWEGVETALQMIVMREVAQGDYHRVAEYLDAARREHAAQRRLMTALSARLAAAERSTPTAA